MVMVEKEVVRKRKKQPLQLHWQQIITPKTKTKNKNIQIIENVKKPYLG
jgi:hypothetical protein